MKIIRALKFLAVIGWLYIARAEDPVQVGGMMDGKELQFPSHIQQKLAEESVDLLAHCTNTVPQPMGTLEWAKKKPHLHLVFLKPRSFDLGIEKKPLCTNVLVKEMVIELPLSSGRAWIGSTPFHYFCSKYNTKDAEKMDKILGSVLKGHQLP
jgi:hypothetical protein